MLPAMRTLTTSPSAYDQLRLIRSQRTDLRRSARLALRRERTAMIPAMTTGICPVSTARAREPTHDALHDEIGPENAHRRDADLSPMSDRSLSRVNARPTSTCHSCASVSNCTASCRSGPGADAWERVSARNSEQSTHKSTRWPKCSPVERMSNRERLVRPSRTMAPGHDQPSSALGHPTHRRTARRPGRDRSCSNVSDRRKELRIERAECAPTRPIAVARSVQTPTST